MKRIVKKPDVRRLEIIRAAEKLFEKLGYTGTSVEAIIKKAGIAKGTFYYYFKAKQDILEAIVEQTALQMEGLFKGILERDNLTALEKFKMMIRGPEKSELVSSAVMSIIHKPENRELQEKLNIQCIEMIAPLLTQVMEEGKRQGIFKRTPTLESVQLILAGSQFVMDSGLFVWSATKRLRFLKSLQNMLELLLGVKTDELNFISNEG